MIDYGNQKTAYITAQQGLQVVKELGVKLAPTHRDKTSLVPGLPA